MNITFVIRRQDFWKLQTLGAVLCIEIHRTNRKLSNMFFGIEVVYEYQATSSLEREGLFYCTGMEGID